MEEGERQTDRQTERQRETERDRERHRERERPPVRRRCLVLWCFHLKFTQHESGLPSPGLASGFAARVDLCKMSLINAQ